jgi:hypothetical protein
MFLAKKHLSRRTFLRGAGVTMALPFLDAMVPALGAQAAPQLRFGAVYWPNGVLPALWHPDTTGSDFAFKPVMAPLEPFRENLLTVSGMVASGTPGPHLGASGGWLNGLGALGAQGREIVSGTSLDQFVADGIAGDTPLRSIELGTEDMGTSIGACGGFSCLYFNAISWRSDTQALPIEINPRVTFERMFGETGTTEQRVARLRYKTSLLDSITQEVGRLRGELGPGDTRVLDNYLTNVREVEQQLQRVMARSDLDIDVPAAPSGVPPSFEEHMQITYDLMLLAYQGDISRVVTFLTGVEASNRGYPFVGVSESHHACSHHGDDPERMMKYTRIVTYQVTQFARFVQRLKDTPDGDGSLLDHTLLYLGSGMSNGNQHDRNTPPAVALGGANGRLRGNRHIAVEDREPAANFLLNLADIAGVEVESIGPSTGRIANV